MTKNESANGLSRCIDLVLQRPDTIGDGSRSPASLGDLDFRGMAKSIADRRKFLGGLEKPMVLSVSSWSREILCEGSPTTGFANGTLEITQMVPPNFFVAIYGFTFAGLLVWFLTKRLGSRRDRPPADRNGESNKDPRNSRQGAPTSPDIDKDLLGKHLEWFFAQIRKGHTEINGFLIQDPASIEGLRCIGMENASCGGRVLCDLSIDVHGICEVDPSNFDRPQARQDLRKIPLLKCFASRTGMGMVYFDGARYQTRSLSDRRGILPIAPEESLHRFLG